MSKPATKPTIHVRVTPALHPDALSTIDGLDETTAPYIAGARGALEKAYEGLNAIWDARDAANRNPTWNEPERLIRTDDFAAKQMAAITKALDGAHEDLKKGIAHIEDQLTGPLSAGGHGALAGEIRAHVKGLSLEERHDFLEKARKDGDNLTLGAVLAAPGYLSGISEVERQARTRLYHEDRAPELSQRLRVMRAAYDYLGAHSGRVFEQAQKAVGAHPHKIQKLRAAKTQAEAAFILKSAV